MDPLLAATAFLLILPVELPDKTFVATLVLATRFRPGFVWAGVCAAFAVQTTIAVTVGGLLGRLPAGPVRLAAGLLFLIGGALLLRGASRAGAEEAEAEAEFSAKVSAEGTSRRSGWGAFATSFAVLFLAEWGDLSQLLTASLAARYADPLSIGLGSFLALAVVSGMAALLGHQLLKRVSLTVVRRIGGGVCLLLGVVTLLSAAGLEIPGLG